MTTISDRPQADVIAALRSRVAGAVLLPDSPGYDAGRLGFNLIDDSRPALVIVAATRDDVVEAVRFADREGLRVAVRATGHGPAGRSDGALLINTAHLAGVAIDPVAASARVDAGATWETVTAAAQQHGLAPLSGSSSGVGAVGYTLGGGSGWLARKYGLAADLVHSFDVVTADGVELTVSASEHPELFWALRGAGAGSLGVVLSMTIGLVPVSTVYAGNLFYPAADAAEVIARFAQWAPLQADDLTSAVTLMNFPPFPEVPEPFRGQSFVIVRGCWSGAADVGTALIDEWRQWRTPLVDTWAEIPFAAIDSVSMDPTDPMPAITTTEWLTRLDADAATVLIDNVYPKAGPPTFVVAEIRHSGSAVARGAEHAVNDRGRSGEFLLVMVAAVLDPHAALAIESAVRLTREALAPFASGGAYLNFVDGSDTAARSAAAFSAANLERVTELKRTIDPANRFCHGVDLNRPTAG